MLGYIPELATTNEAVAKNVPVQSVKAGRQRCQRRGTAVRLPPPTRMGGVVVAKQAIEAKKKREAVEAEAKRKAAIEQAQLEKERAKAETRRQLDAARNARGTEVQYRLHDVDGSNAYISKHFNRTVTSIATNGDATIILYEQQPPMWTAGLPTGLYKLVDNRAKHLPKPTYVALGSFGRYVIVFDDGSSQWVGSDDMSAELQKTKRSIQSVAFGASFDSYFIVYTDGGRSYVDVPAGLSEQIEKRQGRGDLKCVSLGPDGEWYLSVKNSRAWWSGSQVFIDDLRDYKDTYNIQFVDFGNNDQFIFRYSHD